MRRHTCLAIVATVVLAGCGAPGPVTGPVGGETVITTSLAPSTTVEFAPSTTVGNPGSLSDGGVVSPSTTMTVDANVTEDTGYDPIPDGCIILFLHSADMGGPAVRHVVRLSEGKVIMVLEPGEPIPEIDPELCE